MAQSTGDTGVAVLAGLLGLALLGHQIYLIYAIIATRQDVKQVRQVLQGGGRGLQLLGLLRLSLQSPFEAKTWIASVRRRSFVKAES